MAPSVTESPSKRRRVGSSPIKAQPSLFNFFQSGGKADSQHGQLNSRSESSLQELNTSYQRDNGDVSVPPPSSASSKAAEVSECPLCSSRVPFNTIQAHVNSCLDATSVATSTVSSADLVRNNMVSINAASEAASAPSSIKTMSPSERSCPKSVRHPRMTSISELASTLQSSRVPTSAPVSSAKVENQGSSSAFTVLMKSHSESKQWATADAVEASNYRGKARSRPEARTAPFYKALEGMPITVDAFRFGKIEGCRAYFLTHFHSDHYGGMTANWTHGPIYCSLTSANLCRTHLGVDPQWLRPLPMEVPIELPDSGGVTVTCIEANHCPGSCLFLFEGPQTCQLLSRNHASPYIGSRRVFRYLHCGDFRASPVHTNHPSIAGKKLDIIYLDTTYCNPRYCFPAQDQVIEACADLVRRIMPEDQLERKAMNSKAEDGEEQDWRNAPPRTNKGAVDRDSSTAVAFKGWFGIGGGVAAASEDATDATDIKREFDREDSVERTVKDEDENMEYDDEDLFDNAESDAVETDDGLVQFKVKLEATDDSADARTTNTMMPEVDSRKARAEMQPDSTFVNEEEESYNLEPSATRSETLEGEERKPSTSNWLSKHNELSRDSISLGRRKGRLLVVVGTYTIGKERILKAVARAMNSKIFCMDSRKYRVYQQLEDPELHAMLTRSPGASVHVTNLHAINGEGLRDVLAALRTRGHDFTHAVAFRPTGWTYKPPAGMDTVSPSLDRLIQWNQGRSFGPQHLFPTRDSTPDYMIYGVPYSEHSSFFELTAFALSTRYDRIIATVNIGNPTSRAKMAKWFEKWAIEKRRREKIGLHELPARAITYW